jgi:subtilisin family serine protease
MAAPHVAGAAALYLAVNPGATPAQVRTALQNAREAIALPNDRDGINEGVLYAGDGALVPPTTVDAPPVADPTVAPTNAEPDKKKDKRKKRHKHKHKHKKKKRR